ncbi:unnamed protein product [Arctia plantaginis]|uniref:Kinesin motor domain-containing protein n=1 Tax=Arctia plantaginis TaxID=874455 RepID=A0A8S0ZK44_ARCPL|nr:unnamed protein product [Arctia plantaginis]
MTTDKIRKDKNQNIQVFIRLRPLNQRERDIKSLGVIDVVNNREVVVRQSQQTSHTKKFTFDRAFAPNASQLQVYQEVVSPLIEEVLNGYNCTVFAYGQTGTGKTHTMVGEHTGTDTHWQNDPLAGIIPRALSQLFDELRLTNTEYTVRVSYLELYNEELFDLLAASEDNSKLRIYEDVTRKGSNIVNGLEEITVYNKNEVYKIMAQGQERKRVASTLMNAQSSRSHTVFTIVVHMKENSPEGEELVKIGKLNLVDLAGSENISKAGSDNPAKKERARECVNINQSLLTLGRVITALVERHPHIPYRESKLTRILQESLGGRTKTSIIATISPGHKDLEETMSTLEYAHRAKNIQNKPEVNQKMTKKAILKEYAEEIDRLKRDLQASRDKNGVYLASETYAEMTIKEEEQRKEIQELLLKKKAMEDERDRMEGVFGEMNQTLENKNNELMTTMNQLNNTKAALASTSQQLVVTKVACEEQQHLVEVHKSTEQTLSGQARELLATADVATKHVECLHHVVDKRKTVESTNLEVTRTYREQSHQQREAVTAGVLQLWQTLAQALSTLHNALESYTTSSTQTQEQNKQQLDNLIQSFVEIVSQMKVISVESQGALSGACSEHVGRVEAALAQRGSRVGGALRALALAAAAALQRAEGLDVHHHLATFVQHWHVGAGARVSSVRRAHAALCGAAGAARGRHAAAQRAQREGRRQRVLNRAARLQACMEEIQEDTTHLQQCLTDLLSEIETERQDMETRLEERMAEERRLLEERLARHAEIERNALEARLAKKMTKLEELNNVLEQKKYRYKQLHEIQFEADKEELQMADENLEECVTFEEDYSKYMKKYQTEFEEGTDAISVDMEVFSKNVVEVVEHLNNQVLQILDETKTQIEQQVNTVIADDLTSCKQFVQLVDETLTNVVDATKNIMDEFINKIETSNKAAIQDLSAVSTSTSQLICMTQSYHAQHSASSLEAQSQAQELREQLSGAVERLAELEARYLSQEYKVYSPTGKTPARTDYRYPRMLASTSPHERILARFRAMRQNSDEDVILVESEPDSRPPSDSESSIASEDSCVSETYPQSVRKIKEENGKENIQRPVPYKKPSKLPAPTSHKKPLEERNMNGQ